jgi:hypothetical protein
VLEIDPVKLKLVWSYTSPTFFATNISGAQRLLNGNTLITEGPGGRVFEVTNAGAIVWEYIFPIFGGDRQANSVYRAYRLPYAWIPQLPRPAEHAVEPPDRGAFRVPNHASPANRVVVGMSARKIVPNAAFPPIRRLATFVHVPRDKPKRAETGNVRPDPDPATSHRTGLRPV